MRICVAWHVQTEEDENFITSLKIVIEEVLEIQVGNWFQRIENNG